MIDRSSRTAASAKAVLDAVVCRSLAPLSICGSTIRLATSVLPVPRGHWIGVISDLTVSRARDVRTAYSCSVLSRSRMLRAIAHSSGTCPGAIRRQEVLAFPRRRWRSAPSWPTRFHSLYRFDIAFLWRHTHHLACQI